VTGGNKAGDKGFNCAIRRSIVQAQNFPDLSGNERAGNCKKLLRDLLGYPTAKGTARLKCRDCPAAARIIQKIMKRAVCLGGTLGRPSL
jgi:hypothetical protein